MIRHGLRQRPAIPESPMAVFAQTSTPWRAGCWQADCSRESGSQFTRKSRAIPITGTGFFISGPFVPGWNGPEMKNRSEEHTSELQSREQLVCRLLPEKKKVK